ncbi:MAG: putative toxin-antitoxin system toxin component, PIN family [Comamonas sp.]|nr:putative toxin-antitoxin system toxin component, PIN family [Comamonas sp.]
MAALKIILHWPACNASYQGVTPRPVVLDTNIVLDLLVFDEPQVAPVRQLLKQGQLRWVSDAAQRLELERVLTYSQIAPRVAFYGKTVASVLAAFDAEAQILPAAPPVRLSCTDPDDQHFWDLAAQQQALLISKDRAVLKQRKRLASLFGMAVGNCLLCADGYGG